jgi:archaemetzincin
MRLCISLLFLLVFAACHFKADRSTTIAIQPIGFVSADKIEVAKYALDSVYKARVIVLPAVKPPANSFVNIKTPRYRADKLIAFLKDMRPDTVDYIMGLTAFDISITKTDALGRVKEPESLYKDFGIFGLGYKPGKSCVVSYCRLGKDAYTANNRLAKISVHELGHNFGLAHCPNKQCVMTDAVEKISTVDSAAMKLCNRCKEVVL